MGWRRGDRGLCSCSASTEVRAGAGACRDAGRRISHSYGRATFASRRGRISGRAGLGWGGVLSVQQGRRLRTALEGEGQTTRPRLLRHRAAADVQQGVGGNGPAGRGHRRGSRGGDEANTCLVQRTYLGGVWAQRRRDGVAGRWAGRWPRDAAPRSTRVPTPQAACGTNGMGGKLSADGLQERKLGQEGWPARRAGDRPAAAERRRRDGQARQVSSTCSTMGGGERGERGGGGGGIDFDAEQAAELHSGQVVKLFFPFTLARTTCGARSRASQDRPPPASQPASQPDAGGQLWLVGRPAGWLAGWWAARIPRSGGGGGGGAGGGAALVVLLLAAGRWPDTRPSDLSHGRCHSRAAHDTGEEREGSERAGTAGGGRALVRRATRQPTYLEFSAGSRRLATCGCGARGPSGSGLYRVHRICGRTDGRQRRR